MTDKKIIGVKISLTACNRGGLHVTNVEPIHDDAVVYSTLGADAILLSSSRVGWSKPYADNWERVFNAADETN